MINSEIQNALTVDVEDYFHVSAFEKYIKRADWHRYPLRVDRNVNKILDLLDEKSTKATFFVLGWVAEKCRYLVEEIHRRGHEVACHGYGHELIYKIRPEDFRKDVQKSRSLLEDACGQKILGYRAPSFSITKESRWALEILGEENFIYDSSIFPVYHDTYGWPDINPFPHKVPLKGGNITEFPLSVLNLNFINRNIMVPISGGGYLRFFPLPVIKYGITRINEHHGQPAVIYFHPWELDPGQPRIKSSLKSRFRHYCNLSTTEKKIRNLLDSYSFAPMSSVLKSQGKV